MKPAQSLPAAFRPAALVNLSSRRTVFLLNAGGLLLLFLFGYLFLQYAYLVRPEITRPNLFEALRGLDLLSLLITVAAVMLLHELVHAAFFWLYSRHRPQLGCNILFAYAAMPGWYFPRNQFAIIGLSPFVVITLAGLALMPFVPYSWSGPLFIAMTVNAAGAVGDFYVSYWMFSRPRESYFLDLGSTMLAYDMHRPAVLASWKNLLAAYAVNATRAEESFNRLQDRYEIGERYYHTFNHARDVFDRVELLAHEAQDANIVRLAAWYHDAVYDSVAGSENEAQSAQFARDELSAMGLPEADIAEVCRLILLTAGYTLGTWEQASRDDINGHVLLDADLGGMSLPWEAFASQSADLRKETPFMLEDEYRSARTAFLSQFLARERIYYTPTMFTCCEKNARANISREIARLA